MQSISNSLEALRNIKVYSATLRDHSTGIYQLMGNAKV